MLQSAGEAISHDRHFVLKSDTKFTRHFVCDLSTRVSVLSAVTDVLKGDKLLKTRRPNFQIKAQRDNRPLEVRWKGHLLPTASSAKTGA
jgi:hypothetical protein